MTTKAKAAVREAKEVADYIYQVAGTDKKRIETIQFALEHLARSLDEGWQSIETAPKDGTWILAYWPTMKIGEMPCAVFYDEGVYSNPNAWMTVKNNEYGADEVYPTHWMPFTKDPTAETEINKWKEAQK